MSDDRVGSGAVLLLEGGAIDDFRAGMRLDLLCASVCSAMLRVAIPGLLIFFSLVLKVIATYGGGGGTSKAKWHNITNNLSNSSNSCEAKMSF